MALSVKIVTPVTGTYDQPIGLFINNEWIESVSKRQFEVLNPATGEVITSVCEATEEDVDVAVQAARKAFSSWKGVRPQERGRLLLRLADIAEENSDLLAAVESLDNGKPFAIAKGDIDAAIGCIRTYGGWADKIEGKTINVAPDIFYYTRQEPVGVCGQLIPWTFPLIMLSSKIGPALAAGNTIVIKSAEQTPLSALVFANFVKEAGFPPGVFNLLSGFGKVAGEAIALHMDIDKVAFTGSTTVGRSIMKAAASSNLKKVTLELGGKSPSIVFNDADIDSAISWLNFGIYFNQGQVCTTGSRVFVQDGIYDRFLEAFKQSAAQNKVGDPFNPDTIHGPQVSQAQYDRIMSFIESGKKEGARLEIGGKRHGNKGYFMKPTILSNVDVNTKIAQEGIFGPIWTIHRFKNEEEVIELANNSNHGFTSAIHTKDVNTSRRVTRSLQAGTVWINRYNLPRHQVPFGGYKESGIGRELDEAALANYTQAKSVFVRLDGAMLG